MLSAKIRLLFLYFSVFYVGCNITSVIFPESYLVEPFWKKAFFEFSNIFSYVPFGNKGNFFPAQEVYYKSALYLPHILTYVDACSVLRVLCMSCGKYVQSSWPKDSLDF